MEMLQKVRHQSNFWKILSLKHHKSQMLYPICPFIGHLPMQKHKLHLQMLDYTVVNNYDVFQTNLHLW